MWIDLQDFLDGLSEGEDSFSDDENRIHLSTDSVRLNKTPYFALPRLSYDTTIVPNNLHHQNTNICDETDTHENVILKKMEPKEENGETCPENKLVCARNITEKIVDGKKVYKEDLHVEFAACIDRNPVNSTVQQESPSIIMHVGHCGMWKILTPSNTCTPLNITTVLSSTCTPNSRQNLTSYTTIVSQILQRGNS